MIRALILDQGYDIPHQLASKPIPQSNFYYSLNSLDTVSTDGTGIGLVGICSKSDYIEHTYSPWGRALTTRYAALKDSGATAENGD